MEIIKLFFTKNEDLYDKTIEDVFDDEVFKGKTEEEQQTITNNMTPVEIVIRGDSADTLVINFYPSIGYAYSANTYYEFTSGLLNLFE